MTIIDDDGWSLPNIQMLIIIEGIIRICVSIVILLGLTKSGGSL